MCMCLTAKSQKKFSKNRTKEIKRNKFQQTLKEKAIPILPKDLEEIEAGILPSLFYEASITLIIKPEKDITRKS